MKPKHTPKEKALWGLTTSMRKTLEQLLSGDHLWDYGKYEEFPYKTTRLVNRASRLIQKAKKVEGI